MSWDVCAGVLCAASQAAAAAQRSTHWVGANELLGLVLAGGGGRGVERRPAVEGGCSKAAELGNAVAVDEDVLGPDVAVHDAVGVQMLDGLNLRGGEWRGGVAAADHVREDAPRQRDRVELLVLDHGGERRAAAGVLVEQDDAAGGPAEAAARVGLGSSAFALFRLSIMRNGSSARAGPQTT